MILVSLIQVFTNIGGLFQSTKYDFPSKVSKHICVRDNKAFGLFLDVPLQHIENFINSTTIK